MLCSGDQIKQFEKTLPKHAFQYPNEKLSKGSLLIHTGWSNTKKDGLSLDGWTVVRHDNGLPRLVGEFDDDKRKGPLRYFAADGKPRFYANYVNDRLAGVACVFSNDGLPLAVREYSGNLPRAWYVLDYSSGTPLAKAFDAAASGGETDGAIAQQEFDKAMQETEESERTLKKDLKEAFKQVQREMQTKQSQVRRQNDRMNERIRNAQYSKYARAMTSAARALTGDFSAP